MTDTKQLNLKEVEYMRKYTLTPDQRNELIRAKLERAERMRSHAKIQERKQIYT